MGTDQIRKIRKKMEKTLDPKRYEHTLGVAYTASALAMRYQEDMNKALVAGLLHDCAKCMDNEKKLHICQKHHIPVTDIEKKNPYLLHAKVGRHVAKKQFHIHDKDILNAILNHTTGRPGMSPLEKIVFIADYIEPGRKQAPNLALVRTLAFQDLDEALLAILRDTLEYLQRIDNQDPMTQNTYNYYSAQDRMAGS
ncbi:ribonuclease Y [Lachnospiraceae bacterium]|nr:ribonuclease Y [Lachnospiraceae bacterium]